MSEFRKYTTNVLFISKLFKEKLFPNENYVRPNTSREEKMYMSKTKLYK